MQGLVKHLKQFFFICEPYKYLTIQTVVQCRHRQKKISLKLLHVHI